MCVTPLSAALQCDTHSRPVLLNLFFVFFPHLILATQLQIPSFLIVLIQNADETVENKPFALHAKGQEGQHEGWGANVTFKKKAKGVR